MDHDEEEEQTETARQRHSRDIGLLVLGRYGRDYFKALGKKGGKKTSDTYGSEHFVKLGKRGGKRTKSLIARGRAMEAEEEVE